MQQFKLPDLGEGIHEGEILKWHVNPNDMIKEDDPLVDIETDKAAVTIPSPYGGKVVETAGKPGDIVAVGTVLAVIDDGKVEAKEEAKQEAKPATEAPAKEVSKEPTKKTEKVPSKEPAKEKVAAGPVIDGKCSVPAAPATRRLARELGVNICEVTPSGPAGRVTPEDIEAFSKGKLATAQEPMKPSPDGKLHMETDLADAHYAAHAASAIPFLDIEPLPDFTQFGPVETEKLISIRRKVAHKMVTSHVLVPHVAHCDEADVTELDEFRKKESELLKDKPGGKLNLLPFIVKAVAAGLKAAPAFNASIDPFKEEIIYKKYYNVGIAVDTGKGLIVPVVKNADTKSILEISAEIEDMAHRAREGKIQLPELQGGTFSITNIGPLGGWIGMPIINYPEVAILGLGRAIPKPVVRDGQVVIRTMLPITFAFDHRVADGADAARFITEMVRQLSDPNLLLLET